MGIKRSVCSYSSRFEMVETSLPRAYNDEHLTRLVLKQCLSDTSLADKQVIRPGLVNRVLAKLIEVIHYTRIYKPICHGKIFVRFLIQNYGI